MKRLSLEGEALAVSEAEGVNAAGALTGALWTFHSLGAAARQRAEFAAELARADNRAVRDALDAAQRTR